MRPPGPAFDVRTALAAEIRAAQLMLSAPLTAKAVHAGRVSLKRARAVARVGRAVAPGLAAVFDKSARAAMHLLAPTRELAALAAAARASAKEGGRKARAALSAAAKSFDFAGNASAVADHAALSAALKDLHALALVWPEASPRQIARGAEAIVRRARRARRRALASSDPAVRHAWRRREKERLYAAEALGADWPRKRQRKRAARLCDVLGKERDALILLERLSAEPILANDEAAPSAALRVLRKRAKHWRARADAIGARLNAARA